MTAMARPTALVVGALWAYPVLWALGIQSFAWTLMAALMVPSLARARNRLSVPRGFGLWLLFLGWVVASAITLDEFDRSAAAVYRGSCYVAATIILIALVNTRATTVSSRQLVLALTALWGWSVALALVALIAPDFNFRSPFEMLLPEQVRSVPFVSSLVHPRLAGRDEIIGVIRPRAPFQYTNSWGSAIGLLTPVVLHFAQSLRTQRARMALGAALVISLIPIIVSINRGLWLSLAVATAWVIGRRFLRGEVKPLARATAAALAIGTAVWFSPLRDIIIARIHHPNVITRETLYATALRVVGESPVVGYGSPVSGSGLHNSNNVSIGTHGQFWTVLVSQGWPGAVLFTAFLVAMIALTWNVPTSALWLHSVLVVALTQILFYDLLPVGIIIYVVALTLCVRACQRARISEPSSEPVKESVR